ncbi:septum formation inhibitor Maf [Caldichromatium japonicum]|uniref:7-methyl-GTP pyrophosphatase n=1 Tax=Caldichromatium japonicum TaxID=2699430 RepID=A0A6G7VGJ3_9GAMM|nr:septum formation inhibitor Maf [Caldichromatium japonicum]
MHPPPLILASTSPYRRNLLARLGLLFQTDSPAIDERPLPSESAVALVQRLAEAKARAVAKRHPDALIIGSDQVACLDGAILGKPGGRDAAIAQLERAAGHKVIFQTGVCLLDARAQQAHTFVEPYCVHFRNLSRAQIEGYIERERPYDCAGSFKAEGLGIALFARLEGDDPTALIGLPLIRLVPLLESFGHCPLGAV